MSSSVLQAAILFAFVASITPGPNNLMLLSSGSRFGFRKTFPHLMGVNLGIAPLILIIGLGLKELFVIAPWTLVALKALGSTYLLYLAYKILKSAGASEKDITVDKPFTFFQAALFQWVNPKAWTMGITAVSLFAAGDISQLFSLVGILMIVNFFCISAWAGMGVQIRKILSVPSQRKTFNLVVSLLLASSVYPILTMSI